MQKTFRRGWLLRYAIALLSIGLAIGIRILLWPVLGIYVPYITIFPAVALTAWYAGFGPALLAILLGGLATRYYLLSPLHSFATISGEDRSGFVFYWIVSLIIVLFSEAQRRMQQLAEQRLEQLIRERQWSEVTLSSIGDAVIATDVRGRVVFMNPTAASLTGWTRAEAAERPLEEVFQIINERTGAPVENPVTRVLREGQVVGLANHTVLIAKDGRTTPIDDSGAPIRDLAKEIKGVVLVFRDVSERKRAEEALHRQGQLINLAHDAIITMDADRRITGWNGGAQEMYGWIEAEAQGQVIHTFLQTRLSATNINRSDIDRVLRQQGCWDGELIHTRRDGQTLIVESRQVLLSDGRGVPTGILEINRDITERKQAEAGIAQLAAIVESSDDAIIGQDLNGMITSWNQAAERMFGYSAAEAVGRSISMLAPSNHVDEIPEILDQIRRGERVEHFETVRQRKDGQLIDVSLTISPIWDNAGRIIGISKIVRDITERRQAERERARLLAAEQAARAEAEETQRRWAFLAEASAVLASSLDYQVTLVSVARLAVPHFADWCSVEMVEEDGRIHPLAVTHVDPAKMAWANELRRRYPPDPKDARGPAQVLRTGRSELYPEIPDALLVEVARDAEHLRILRELGMQSVMIVPLGTRGHTLGVISFVLAESGRRYGPSDLALAEDLARRAALAVDNARLYSMAKRERQRLEEANRAKDEFLATISHELRTPLTSMLGWTRMLRTNTLDDAMAARALETIERNAKVQAQLIEDLLDVSRIISGKLHLQARPVLLAPVIETAVDALHPAAQAKGIRIERILRSDVGPVWGDPDRLQQIVWNLLSNALKFTPSGGRVTVRLESADSQAKVIVSDTGQGIAPDFLPHVFDRFRQADSTITRKHGGLGLGLAIVRHLVELHGGTVQAESPGPGQGTTFTVALPLMADQPVSGRALARPRTAPVEDPAFLNRLPRLDGLRVLVVEDEADTRDLLVTILERSGAQVSAVASVQETLETLPWMMPDVLVSDIGLPDQDGYALIRQVRARPPEQGGRIPAVALTAHARVEDRLRTLSAGYQMHVSKPVEPAELVTILASLLGRTGPSG